MRDALTRVLDRFADTIFALFDRAGDAWDGFLRAISAPCRSLRPPSPSGQFDISPAVLAVAIDISEIQKAMRQWARQQRMMNNAPRMYHLLSKSAETFRLYERLHDAKGTPEGNAKAKANAVKAAEIEKLLHFIDQDRG